MSRQRSAEQQGQPRTFGITQKGKPCQICIRQGGFCYLHKSQRGSRNVRLEREDLRDINVNEEQSGPSRVFGVTRTGEACKVCIRIGDFCHHHKGQRNRNVTSRRENLSPARIHDEGRSGPSRIYGYTHIGLPCKICIQRNDFCRHHEWQKPRGRNVTSANELLTEDRANEGLHHPKRTFGITQSGRPCKVCIQQGDFCHFHDSQRDSNVVLQRDRSNRVREEQTRHPPVRNVASANELLTEDRTNEGPHHPHRTFGITQSGRPCKVCMQQSDFCHFHDSQRDSNVVLQRDRSNRAREEQTRHPVVFGVTKKGEPCMLCIRRGDYCHRHESQRESAECKECTICLESIQADHMLDVLPCGHEFHRNCFGEWRKYGGSCPLCRQ
jgi:hypothetical protein